ncbi:MAG: TIR domain-containing protein, partial [Polyangiaceae bacterium]
MQKVAATSSPAPALAGTDRPNVVVVGLSRAKPTSMAASVVFAQVVVKQATTALPNGDTLARVVAKVTTQRVFISYSPKDEALLGELTAQLEVLRASGVLDTWHSRKLVPGDVTLDRQSDELERADVIVLLVSADYLASEHIREIEGARALQRHEHGQVRVVPVLLRPCLWEEAAFAHLAPLPAGGRPITSWPNRDEAWLEVAKGIRDLAKDGAAQSAKRESLDAPGPREPCIEKPDPLLRIDWLLREVEAARARKDALVTRGEDVTAIGAEITKLKHELRAGGQLQQNDSLGDGRYYLLRELGRGGFATVWEADDREEGTRVAIKVLHPQLARDPARRERFFRGARAMAKLDHPNVVRVLVPYEEDGGFYYFVMELLPGGDLH